MRFDGVKRAVGKLPGVRRSWHRLARRPPRARSPFDYEVISKPRWGYDNPPHEELTAIIAAGRSGYLSLVDEILADESLRHIPVTQGEDRSEPHWHQEWFPALDASALYVMTRRFAPRTHLEIGSGISTMFCRRAVSDYRLDTRIISIDPAPRADIDSLCDEVVRSSVETLDPSFFDRLGEGDVLFIDGSHRTLMNSDVTMLWLDVLPRLKPGVIVHIHDVFLPYDYPPEWASRYYSEQYMLAASLLAGNPMEILFPSHFVQRDAALASRLDPLWEALGLDAQVRVGGSFWFRIREIPLPVR